MTAVAGSVDVRVSAETSQLDSGLNRAKSQTAQFTRQVDQSTSRAGRSFIGLGAIATRALGPLGAAGALAGLANRVLESTRRHTELSNAILLTGNASRTTVRQIEDLSFELSRSTGRSIDDIRTVTAALVRQGVEAGQTMRDIVTTASRLSAAGFGTFEQNMQRLTMSIRDPRAALISLDQEGMRFSAGTIEQVRRLTNLGQAHKAHQVLLEELKTKNKDITEQTPSLMDALKSLLDDLALAAAKALGEYEKIEDVVKRVVGLTRNIGDFVSGRAEDTRIRNRGLEQLRQDILDIETAIAALRNGQGLGEVWKKHLEGITGITAIVGGAAAQIHDLEQAMFRFRKIQGEILGGQLKGPIYDDKPKPARTDPARMFAQGDDIDRLRRRLVVEREVLGMTEAQAKAHEIIAGLKERHVTLGPKIAESLRREIIELESIKSLMRTINDAASSVFTGMTDALTDFAVTGKFEFKKMADSIIRDLLRIAMQAYVVRPLLNLTNSFAAGMMPGSFGTSWTPRVTPAGFAEGGQFRMPGSGGRDRPALVGLTPGELVTITPQHRVGSEAGQMIQNVTIHTTREFEETRTERQGAGGFRVQDIVLTEVSKAIGRGDLDMPMESRFGTRARTSKR